MRRLATISALALTAVFLVATVVIVGSDSLGPSLAFVGISAGAAGFAAIGAALAVRKPNNSVGWLLLAAGFFFGLNIFGEAFAVYSAVELERSLEFSQIVLGVAGVSFLVTLFSISMLLILFPTGHLLSRQWRWSVRWLIATLLVGAGGDVVTARSVTDIEGFLANSWSLDHAGQALSEPITILVKIGVAMTVLSLIVGAVALVVRFRRSSGVERQQLEWVVYAGMFTALSLPAIAPVGLPLWIRLVSLVAAMLVLPAGFAIALFRHRLYDIDRLINRTVVYGAVVVVLVGVYGAAIFVLRDVLPVVEGDLAVAASTLAVAALFNPLRLRVQTAVDRRFYRSRYDAQRVVEEFSHRLAEEIDLDALAEDWLATVDQAVKPETAQVWLR